MVVEFRFEPLNYLLNTGLADLGEQSWAECGNDKELFSYDPDWARYGRMENSNILRFVAARNAGELVGYASIIITDNLHDKKICCAIIQDIFVKPENRKNRTSDNLLDFIEDSLCNVGVQHISAAERIMVGNVGRWLRRRKYRCNEKIWTKILSPRRMH